MVQAPLDNLLGRGLGSAICHPIIVDKAKALPETVRNSFGRHTPNRRRQVHKAGNITGRLAKPLHAIVRRERKLDDVDTAERLINSLACRLEHDSPDVSTGILGGLDEILTLTRLGSPGEPRRSLACTDIIKSMTWTIRQVCRNVKRWRDAGMVLRWTRAAMLKAAKGFRRSKLASNYRSCGWRRRPIRSATASTPTLNNRSTLRNLFKQQCLPNEIQQWVGHPRGTRGWRNADASQGQMTGLRGKRSIWP